jgi:hypothetical protein
MGDQVHLIPYDNTVLAAGVNTLLPLDIQGRGQFGEYPTSGICCAILGYIQQAKSLKFLKKNRVSE